MATHKVVIDNSLSEIEWDNKTIKIKADYEFNQALKIILSTSQKEAFDSDTRKSFQVSDKKLAKLEEFIKK